MKTIEQINQELDAPIPASKVSTRSGGGGKSLSYLEAHYVIDRLNKVFGNLSWDSETVEMTQLSGDKPSYRCKVKITARIQVGDGQYLDVVKEGTGFGSDKGGPNPHELAVKEAESDALKRAAMKFGMSMGLALYDKDQPNVEDDSAGKSNSAALPSSKTQQPPAASSEATTLAPNVSTPSRPSAKDQHAERPQGAPSNRELLNKNITSISKIAMSKGKASQEDLVAELKKYGAAKKEDLSDTDAQKLFDSLKALVG
jgi:DNA recombination protein Rad52